MEAFEINEVANDVYEHNFGHRPSQVSITASLSYKDYVEYISVWACVSKQYLARLKFRKVLMSC